VSAAQVTGDPVTLTIENAWDAELEVLGPEIAAAQVNFKSTAKAKRAAARLRRSPENIRRHAAAKAEHDLAREHLQALEAQRAERLDWFRSAECREHYEAEHARLAVAAAARSDLSAALVNVEQHIVGFAEFYRVAIGAINRSEGARRLDRSTLRIEFGRRVAAILRRELGREAEEATELLAQPRHYRVAQQPRHRA
jgi:hypothetical protein